ncbi:TIR domain-containing protein [Fictibacillus aquaticus]|uniref:TIR domain-containing protein n=1 Tax=Fictibacillus aquaticus TaxID=2021314 RepID=A0A235F967_9BACL|nr:toll/interleukin-1 receptor domain-containing protein [Fictibacillus aquaticus]OYD57901.1 hypothetical protein CGZ90_08345 [Fictibacillus aquaticus]
MSTSTLQTQIKRTRLKISDLKKKLSKEQENESKARKELIKIKKSITKNTSVTMLKNKLSKSDKLNVELEKSLKEQSSLNKKLLTEEKLLTKYEEDFYKAQEKETKKLSRVIDSRIKQSDAIQDQISQELSILRQKTQKIIDQETEKIQYDVFISHSTNDKESIVSELSNLLESKGYTVFEDVKVFKIGDSISRKINDGIIHSKFGVVVLSPSFIKSAWATYEFTGFLMREMSENKKVILPIWHDITKEEVSQFNPTLLDKFSLSTDKHSVEEIANLIAEALPDPIITYKN